MTRGDILRMAIRNKKIVVDEADGRVERGHPQLGREINLKFTFFLQVEAFYRLKYLM